MTYLADTVVGAVCLLLVFFWQEVFLPECPVSLFVSSLCLSFLLTTVLLELPVPVVQRTNRSGFEPPRNAVEVECVLGYV